MRVADLLRTRTLDALETRVLLRTALGATDSQLAAAPERELSAAELERYDALVRRRSAGEPIAYITGEREFYGLAFRVTPAVLIPRPETELLVELVLERTGTGQAQAVLDLATGSGCIAIAVANCRPHARVSASDVSPAALALARENALAHGANIEFVESDWFAAFAGRRFDVIASNPPYVAAADPHLGAGDLRYEPRSALAAGETGYECIERIVEQAPRQLARGGWLILEHGYEQGAGVRERLERSGYASVFTATDLAGHERASGGRV